MDANTISLILNAVQDSRDFSDQEREEANRFLLEAKAHFGRPKDEIPHQRYEVRLSLGGCSLDDVVRKLRQVEIDLLMGQEGAGRSWVSSDTGILSMRFDPAVTKESYEADVRAFADSKLKTTRTARVVVEGEE